MGQSLLLPFVGHVSAGNIIVSEIAIVRATFVHSIHVALQLHNMGIIRSVSSDHPDSTYLLILFVHVQIKDVGKLQSKDVHGTGSLDQRELDDAPGEFQIGQGTLRLAQLQYGNWNGLLCAVPFPALCGHFDHINLVLLRIVA